MIGSSIEARSLWARRRGRGRAAWAVAGALILLAPAARAQNLFFLFDPPPLRIERQLEAAGYELRGPLVRRGDVYVCDVVAETGVRERLVVDARTARILERFSSDGPRWRRDRFGDWRDRDGDGSPRPPWGVAQDPQNDGWRGAGDDLGPLPGAKPRDEIAGVDPSGKPTILYGEDGTKGALPTELERPKPKPHVAKKKPAPAAPLAKGSPTVAPPPDGAPPSPPGNPTASTSPPDDGSRGESVKAKSVEAKPTADSKPIAAAEETKPVAEAKPVAGAEPVAETKPVAEAKPTSEAKVAPTPEPRPEKKAKAVNDVPVNPLD